MAMNGTLTVTKKDFFRKAVTIGLPMAGAQLIQTLINSLDVFMTGQLGETSIAGLGLANQISFLYILISFGIASGNGIFIAQYWGKKDEENIQKVVGVGLTMMVVPMVIFVLATSLFPEVLMRFYTKDVAVIAEGVKYLRIISISYLFTGFTFMFTMAARSTEQVKIPLIVGACALLLNSVLNYGLILGNFGLPRLGVQGAAIGTTISRFGQFLVMIWVSKKMHAPYMGKLRTYFSYDLAFFRKVVVTATPALLNEVFWSLGVTVYNMVYARIGTEAYAAVNIVVSIEDLAFVLFIGMGNACAVMIGNQIGAGHEENAKFFAKHFLRTIVISAVILGGVLILVRPWVLSIYQLSELGRTFAMRLMILSGVFLWVRSANFTIFIGILRSGGDTKYAMVAELMAVWLVGVPMALLGGFVLHLPVYFVYPMVVMEEVVKFVISFRRYRSMKWLNNLVSEDGQALDDEDRDDELTLEMAV